MFSLFTQEKLAFKKWIGKDSEYINKGIIGTMYPGAISWSLHETDGISQVKIKWKSSM